MATEKGPGVQGRESVVSSFTIIKGALIAETYAAFTAWDLAASKRENLQRITTENPIAARSSAWLRDVAKVLNRRFDPSGRDRALVLLAQKQCPLETWKPILLWHMTRDEFLLRDFLLNWLYPAWEAGVYRVRTDEVEGYLRSVPARGGTVEHEWTQPTRERVILGLVRLAVDFGLLEAPQNRQFCSYHLPEEAFVYLLLAMADQGLGAVQILGCEDWRMYLMRSSDVESELFGLHQYRKLEYQVAGTLSQLALPYDSALDFAERWTP